MYQRKRRNEYIFILCGLICKISRRNLSMFKLYSPYSGTISDWSACNLERYFVRCHNVSLVAPLKKPNHRFHSLWNNFDQQWWQACRRWNCQATNLVRGVLKSPLPHCFFCRITNQYTSLRFSQSFLRSEKNKLGGFQALMLSSYSFKK